MFCYQGPARSLPPRQGIPIFTGFVETIERGLAPGEIWTDDPNHPAAAHARHGYGMGLIWGPGVEAAQAALADHFALPRAKDEWLQIDPAWDHLPWEALFGTGRTERHVRMNFRFDEELFRSRWSGFLPPPGWHCCALGEEAFALPDITISPDCFWKSFAIFQAQGGGIVARREDGEIGALAFSGTAGAGWLEIGIETRVAHRGQGLARAVAVAMIQRSLEQGLMPVWACRKGNEGSFRLAQSLGFVPVREIPYYRLKAD